MSNTVLVTGGAGFIGSHVTEILAKQGYDVTVFDSFVNGRQDNIAALDVEVVKGDIRDESLLADVLPGMDGIFHLAAHVGNVKSIENPHTDSSVNIDGTITLLEAACEFDVTDFIYTSSAATFGEVEYTPVDELHPVNPDSPYGVSKLSGEKYARCYGRLNDIDVVALRYFNVYGENQYYDEYGNVIPIWVHRLLNDESLIIYGDGEQTRDFVNVRDVARANKLAYEADVRDEVYNIGSGEATQIKDLAEMLLDVADRETTIMHEPPREGEVRHSVADITKSRDDLGYTPSIPLVEGLEAYVNWKQTHV